MPDGIKRLRPRASVFDAAVGDEAVLYDQASGSYYGLNPVAARVWQMFGAGTPLEEIALTLVKEFAVDREQADRDLKILIEEFHRSDLTELA